MANEATPAPERTWLERNLAALMIGIFGSAVSALMVVMVGSINNLNGSVDNLRSDLANLDTSLASIQTEMVSTRVTIAEEVALVDDDIINSIGDLRADMVIANQHLTGIDTHLALIKREFARPADFSLSSSSSLTSDVAEISSEISPAFGFTGDDNNNQRDK